MRAPPVSHGGGAHWAVSQRLPCPPAPLTMLAPAAALLLLLLDNRACAAAGCPHPACTRCKSSSLPPPAGMLLQGASSWRAGSCCTSATATGSAPAAGVSASTAAHASSSASAATPSATSTEMGGVPPAPQPASPGWAAAAVPRAPALERPGRPHASPAQPSPASTNPRFMNRPPHCEFSRHPPLILAFTLYYPFHIRHRSPRNDAPALPCAPFHPQVRRLHST